MSICAFCHRSEMEVKRIIISREHPSAAICNDCILTCIQCLFDAIKVVPAEAKTEGDV